MKCGSVCSGGKAILALSRARDLLFVVVSLSLSSTLRQFKLSWKTTISIDLQQPFEKICKNHQNVRKSENIGV